MYKYKYKNEKPNFECLFSKKDRCLDLCIVPTLTIAIGVFLAEIEIVKIKRKISSFKAT